MNSNAKTDRNNAIVEDRKAGMTYAEISEKYGISKERVRQLVVRTTRKDRCGTDGLPWEISIALIKRGITTKTQLLEAIDGEGFIARQIGPKMVAEIESFTGRKLEKSSGGKWRGIREGF